jgi:AhpD family alkylhydroperoxidase
MHTDFPALHRQVADGMVELGADLPGVMAGFSALHEAAMGPGELDTRTKELIALGIAITIRCQGCIAFHVKDALDAGATPAEIEETIGVAICMGGGPSIVYGVEAAEALTQFLETAAVPV